MKTIGIKSEGAKLASISDHSAVYFSPYARSFFYLIYDNL
jgi:hypothetical protein